MKIINVIMRMSPCMSLYVKYKTITKTKTKTKKKNNKTKAQRQDTRLAGC